MTNMERLLRPRGRAGSAMWMGAVALLAIAAWLSEDAYVRFDVLRREQAAVDRLRVPVRPASPPPLSREDREHDRRLAALHAERGFRWYPVFKGLEQASSEDIELLEFAPDKVNKTFILRGEARDTAALLAYLAALAQQESFGDVYLAHQKQGRRDNLAVQRFEMRGRIR